MEPLKQLGRYQIEEHIGSGAYADVYRATDTTLKRTVALKVLKPMLLADEDAFARFVQEAQTAAGLFHPHIATVLDLGEADGRYLLAIHYVDGPSLDRILAERESLTWKEGLEITAQIAVALLASGGDPNPVVSSLIKLSSGLTDETIDIETFLRQAEGEAASTAAAELASTHSFINNRIKNLLKQQRLVELNKAYA